MEQVIEIFIQYWKEILAVFSSAVSVLGTLILFLRTSAISHALKAAKKRQTYTVCPHCHKPIELERMDFFLPGGIKDNNLNGVADDKE